MMTLADKLGSPWHHSLLLRKAEALVGLAVARGCHHYGSGWESTPPAPPSHETFSDEELVIVLLSPCLPFNPRAMRVGAQMLGSRRNQPARLALLARRERAENIVRHIAVAGQQTEPEEPWRRKP